MLRKINKATSKQLTNSNTRRQTLKRNTTRMHATMKMYNPKSSGSTQDLHTSFPTYITVFLKFSGELFTILGNSERNKCNTFVLFQDL